MEPGVTTETRKLYKDQVGGVGEGAVERRAGHRIVREMTRMRAPSGERGQRVMQL